MNIQSLDNWDDVEPYTDDWERILDAAPSLTIFSTREWLRAWWESYGAGSALRFLLLRDDAGTIVAMVPLYITVADSVFGKLRLARLVGDGSNDSDGLEFICLPGREAEAALAVLRWIKTSRSCDLCQLNTVSSPSSLTVALERWLRTPFWARSFYQHPQVVVSLPATWGEYLQQLSAKERGKAGIRARRLEKEFTTDYVRVTSPDDLDRRLDRLFHLHQMRWARRNDPGSFSVPERRAFYRKICAEFLRRGWLEFWFLELNKVPVAAQFAFAYRGAAYSLQEGFDPNYTSNSVGYVLRCQVLRRMIEAGVRKYDFLGGRDDSKLRWAGQQSHYLDVHMAPGFGRGGAFIRCRKLIFACKDWGRKYVPAEARRRLKTILSWKANGSSPETQATVKTPSSVIQDAPLQPIRLSLWS